MNNLTVEIRNSKSVNAFKLIKWEKIENSIFSIYNLLSVLRLQFSHLNQHKFRHRFGDAINTI